MYKSTMNMKVITKFKNRAKRILSKHTNNLIVFDIKSIKNFTLLHFKNKGF